MHPTLARLLELHERKARRGANLLLGMVIGMGVMFLLAALPRALSPVEPLLLLLLLLFGSAFPILGFVMVRTMTKNSRVLRELFEQPASIVWVYGERHTVNGIPAARPVMVTAVDKDARCNAGSQDKVMLELFAALPHVIRGYGPAQENRYLALVEAHTASRAA